MPSLVIKIRNAFNTMQFYNRATDMHDAINISGRRKQNQALVVQGFLNCFAVRQRQCFLVLVSGVASCPPPPLFPYKSSGVANFLSLGLLTSAPRAAFCPYTHKHTDAHINTSTNLHSRLLQSTVERQHQMNHSSPFISLAFLASSFPCFSGQTSS